MTIPSANATGSKPSFASVAAMAPPPRIQATNMKRETREPAAQSFVSSGQDRKLDIGEGPQLPRDLHESMSRLEVKGPPISKTLNEQAKTNIKRAGLRLDDEHTHVSSSSTKPPSLDGKSTTSGTTFALDEKESLRPDDSASVQALEDEDSASGPASGAPNSRGGSEAGGRTFRDQLYEINDNIGTSFHRPHPLSRKVIEGIEEEGPQVIQTPHVPAIQTPLLSSRPEVAPQISGPMDLFLHREPDEKLFEALDSPKDRFFILRLEKDIIEFIKDSTAERMILPPCNSFCRLLAHKLADYYTLTHWVDNAVSAVTLYRTPYCRIPTPLGELAKARAPTSAGITPAPTGMKIMRRPGGAKDSPTVDSGLATAESSALPSKAGSEVDDDGHRGMGVVSPAESVTAKEKASMSREEREARYREKREELFGPQSENPESPESTKEASRASSRNEKRKKKYRKDDDGFEARSAFNAYYPAMQYPVNPFDQSAISPAFYDPYCTPQRMQLGLPGHHSGLTAAPLPQQAYPNSYPPISHIQSYPPSMGQTQINNLGGYNVQAPQTFQAQPSPPQSYTQQQTPTQYYSQMHQPMSIRQHLSAPSAATTSPEFQMSLQRSQPLDQAKWAQNIYGSNSQQFNQSNQSGHFMLSPTPSMPYPYGQLPYPAGSDNAAHPLPGSYNRSAFNPQTRAFVPGGSSNMSPQYPSPHQSLPQTLHHYTPPFPNGPPYLNQHQPVTHHLSTPSIPSPGSHPMDDTNTDGTPAPARRGSNPYSTHAAPSHQDYGAQQSSLSKWGTPATLPRKPPPVETPDLSESQHSLPMNNHFGVNLQAPVIDGGQPMPHFQNGIYSMPGVHS